MKIEELEAEGTKLASARGKSWSELLGEYFADELSGDPIEPRVAALAHLLDMGEKD